MHKDPLVQQAWPVRTQRWACGKCVDPQQSDQMLALEKPLADTRDDTDGDDVRWDPGQYGWQYSGEPEWTVI